MRRPSHARATRGGRRTGCERSARVGRRGVQGDGVVLKIVPMGGERLVSGEARIDRADRARLWLRNDGQLRPRRTRRSRRTPRRVSSTPSPCPCAAVRTRRSSWRRGPSMTRKKIGERNPRVRRRPAARGVRVRRRVDLEHVHLSSAAEARSTLMQITIALAVAEGVRVRTPRFPHWGNVLLRRCGVEETRVARLSG